MLCSFNEFNIWLYLFIICSGRRTVEDSDDEDFEMQSVTSHASTTGTSGDEGLSALDTWEVCKASTCSQEARLNIIYIFLIVNFSCIADGFDEGAEEADVEDDFEQILAENIDGATQRRFVSKFNIHFRIHWLFLFFIFLLLSAADFY